MIRTKNTTVNIENLHINLKQFLTEMSSKFDGIVVSSGNDATHIIGSRHYLNKAIDIGANSSNANAYASFKAYVLNNEALKKEYDIEDIIDEGNHIHIELPLTVKERNVVYFKRGLVVFLLIGIATSVYLKFIKK